MKKQLLTLVFACLFSTIAVADDAPAKKGKKKAAQRNSPAVAILKQLEEVNLTDDQKTKIQELAKKSMTDMRAARKEAGINAELMKKRMAAVKELKESGKNPKEASAEANKKAGLTEAQVAVLNQANSQRSELLKNAIALLSEEQKAKLPKRLVAIANGKTDQKKARNGKGKRKKKTAAEN